MTYPIGCRIGLSTSYLLDLLRIVRQNDALMVCNRYEACRPLLLAAHRHKVGRFAGDRLVKSFEPSTPNTSICTSSQSHPHDAAELQ